MKKLILLFCLGLIAVSANAQVFGGPGSTWWVQVGGGVEHARIRYTYTGDTLINSKSYKVITGKKATTYYSPIFQQWISGFNILPTQYVAVNSDTVAVLNNGVDVPKYIFNAAVGDTISNTVVIGVQDTIINNDTLRMQTVKHLFFDTPQKVVEKIGCITNNLFPDEWATIDSNDVGDGYDYYLTCFQSNEFGLLTFSYDENYAECEWAVDINNTIIGNIAIYPNPTTDYLKIEGLKNQQLSYSLYSYSGALLMQAWLVGNTIDVAGLPQGFYLLQLVDKAGGSKSFKVVKN